MAEDKVIPPWEMTWQITFGVAPPGQPHPSQKKHRIIMELANQVSKTQVWFTPETFEAVLNQGRDMLLQAKTGLVVPQGFDASNLPKMNGHAE